VSDQDIQMLRKNLREQRRQVITTNMKLTDAEAEKFWPLYDQYISDLVRINNTKYDLIKQYLQAQGNLSDAQADSVVKQWIGVDQSVPELRLKYVPAFRKMLSAKNTALFYQVDQRIQLMIDLQLVSALPMAEPYSFFGAMHSTSDLGRCPLLPQIERRRVCRRENISLGYRDVTQCFTQDRFAIYVFPSSYVSLAVPGNPFKLLKTRNWPF
jgi:hypothetical protein